MIFAGCDANIHWDSYCFSVSPISLLNLNLENADRLELLWKLRKRVRTIFASLERRVSQDALTHIVPTLKRYDYRTTKLYEIANMSEKSLVEEAYHFAIAKQDSRLHVYVNGWLNKSRGLDFIDRAAEFLERENCKDIVFNVAINAGRATGVLSNFLKRCNVNNHLGYLSHTESLAQCPANDVVVTFYDPAIRINRYALPNKWSDSIAMETPIILNEGIETAAPLITAGIALTVPFDDSGAFIALLRSLHCDNSQLVSSRRAIAKIKNNYKSFDEAIIPVLTVFLESSELNSLGSSI